MKTSMQEHMKSFLKKHNSQNRWKKIMSVVGVLVAAVTIYALVLPAITMEKKTFCGTEEHTHSEECYEEVLACGMSEDMPTRTELVMDCKVEIHAHTDSCYDQNHEVICGYADYVIHKHDQNCYGTDGNLICTLPENEAHTHTPDCFVETTNLICGMEESEEHIHDESCYETTRECICGKPENIAHEHTDSCYENGVRICGMPELKEHVHNEDCVHSVTVEAPENQHAHTDGCYEHKMTCGMEEHQHNQECYADPDDTAGTADEMLSEKTEEEGGEEEVTDVSGNSTQMYDPDSVIVATADANTPVPYAEADFYGMSPMWDNEEEELRKEEYAAFDMQADASGQIRDYLTEAGITINGAPYQEGQLLKPGEQFSVNLKWELIRDDLNKTRVYEYEFPEQIKIEDTKGSVDLTNDDGEVLGTYRIKNGVLTVEYQDVADKTTTSFKLDAHWNEDKINQETKVDWNDKLSTNIKFDKSALKVKKENLGGKSLGDGSFVYEYAIGIEALGDVKEITLTDTLEAEKFHFCPGYYENDGKKYDYRYKIVNADGTESYEYANFKEGEYTKETTQITFPVIEELKDGQKYTVEYAVKIDPDDRFELDQWLTPTQITNTAKTSYPDKNDTITSSAQITDTYRSEDRWVIKEKGNLSEDDTSSAEFVPWKVTINSGRDYDMSGMLVVDAIGTPGVIYHQEKPVEIICTTGKEPDVNEQKLTPRWIELSDEIIDAILGVGGNAIDILFQEDGKYVLQEIEKSVGGTVTRDTISNYVFVNESGNKFAWFAPEIKKDGKTVPATYQLSYETDIRNAEGNVLSNNALGGWKHLVSGDETGFFFQEVTMEKKNVGVEQIGDDYFVDWDIIVKVPAGRSAIENVFIHDSLPYHETEKGTHDYDWLVGLPDEFDCSKVPPDMEAYREYMNTFTKDAFQISMVYDDGEEGDVSGFKTTLGHPVKGFQRKAFETYKEDGDGRGQMKLTNVPQELLEDYRDCKSCTPTQFGVWLGTLPATRSDGKDTPGYTIKVKYRTQVAPEIIKNLDGVTYGYNYAELKCLNTNGADTVLVKGGSDYNVAHTIAKHTLNKSVAGHEKNEDGEDIITYKVDINPLATLDSYPEADYIIRDLLNPPGAEYVKGSFELSFEGNLQKSPEGNLEFKQAKGEKLILWQDSEVFKQIASLPEDVATAHAEEIVSFLNTSFGNSNTDPYVKYLIMTIMGKNVTDGKNENIDNGNFELHIKNAWPYLQLAPSSTGEKGKFLPMTMTYKVKIPKGMDDNKIKNGVTLSVKAGELPETLVDGANTEFDYSSAMHKVLETSPDGSNGYKASFSIDIDKTVETWKGVEGTFTVTDEMSKSLVPLIKSVGVVGVDADGNEVTLPKESVVISYDDNSSTEKNFLSVTITDSNEYEKYYIKYDAKVQGEAKETVDYDNVASIAGTNIKSNEVKDVVYIQEESGNAIKEDYMVTLLKYDGNNTNNLLDAKFKISVYNGTEWIDRGEIETKGGKLELKNEGRFDNPQLLKEDTWYKLEEIEVTEDGNKSEDYIMGTTYFYVGIVAENAALPEGMDENTPYTSVSFEGTEAIYQIFNYKASLKIHKVSSVNENTSLSGAEFRLYEDVDCKKEVGTLTAGNAGIYSFELGGLDKTKTYYLKETKAPDGYIKSEAVYTVTFDDKGKVTVKNMDDTSLPTDGSGISLAYRIENKASYELPKTGGLGILLYTMAGIALIATAGFMYKKELKKRRIRVKNAREK